MSKNAKNGKKQPVVEKPPHFPFREEIKENPLPAPELLVQLQQIYGEKQHEYFEKEATETLKKYFDLFDRDQDEVINFEEMKEVLIALNYKVDEEDLLRELYMLLERESMVSNLKGIDFENLKVILCKEKKDKDLKTIMINAFSFFDPENTGYIDSKTFREVLMYFGYKYDGEQIESFMKFADPKGEGKIVYFDFAEQLSNLIPPKKKKALAKTK